MGKGGLMLTKIPVELLQGSGTIDGLITFDGVNLIVDDTTDAKQSTMIGSIAYNKVLGELTIVIIDKIAYDLDNNNVIVIDSIVVPGFVKVSDMRMGRQGNYGRRGLNGLNGLNGRDGIMGIPGPEGFRGLRGARGLPGPRGYRGPKGLQGPKGQKGAQGNKGPKGDSGLQGLQGETGKDGITNLLPIVVSSEDPGAIGEGALWIKVTNFEYKKDNVNFTTIKNKEDARCKNTMRALVNGTSSTLGIYSAPDYIYRNIRIDSHYYCYKFAFVDSYCDGSTIVLATAQSTHGITSIIIVDDTLRDLGQYYGDNARCCMYKNGFVVVNSTMILFTYSNNIVRINVPITINDIFASSEALYLCCKEGLFVYDESSNQIVLVYSDNFVHGFCNEQYIFAVASNFTFVDTIMQTQENLIEGQCIMVYETICIVRYENDLLSVYSYDGNFLYSALCDVQEGNLAYRGDAVYYITPFGIQYLVTTHYNVTKEDSLIMYDDNTILIEEKL